MIEQEPLALKYRPRTFQGIVGQEPVRAVLYFQVKTGRVPRAMLFLGPRGSGKTSAARVLGAALNCQGWRSDPRDTPVIPCHGCLSCKAVEDGTSLDVLEVDAASNGGVAEIRRLRELTYYAAPGDWRAVLLDEAHSMSRDAFNALLKVLEEPPPRTVFILVTTEPTRIMSTVASRCQHYPFRRIPVPAIARRLREIADAEGLRADDELLELLAERADGAMRDAVMALDQLAPLGLHTAASYRALHGETDFAPRLVAAMAGGDHAVIFAALDETLGQVAEYSAVTTGLVRCLRDMLVLAKGGSIAAAVETLAARQRLARQLETARVVSAMKVFWELRTRARAADPRSTLEAAVVLASDALRPVQAASNGHGGVPWSVEEMQAMART
jgi:DNA polymerase III subunit gamma/tau